MKKGLHAFVYIIMYIKLGFGLSQKKNNRKFYNLSYSTKKIYIVNKFRSFNFEGTIQNLKYRSY